MNSNHPITELETAIRDILAPYVEWDTAPDATWYDNLGHSVKNPTAALTALCREYAASELRLAAGEDEPLPELPDLDDIEHIATDLDVGYAMRVGRRSGSNELRRTLRVRAEELEAGR